MRESVAGLCQGALVPDLVKVETLTAALDITRPDEIEIYVTMFDQMRQAAKFRANAKALIIKARDELLQ